MMPKSMQVGMIQLAALILAWTATFLSSVGIVSIIRTVCGCLCQDREYAAI